MKQEQIQKIALKEIRVTGENARQHFELNDLIASIKAQGLLQPIIVRPNGKGYKLVAGERRYRACMEIAKQAKDKNATIPAIVRDLTDEQAFEQMTVENLQRENLTPLEEAKALAAHIEKLGDARTVALADAIGKSVHWIRRHVAVLDLHPAVLEDWNQGKLAFGHLEVLLRVKDNEEMYGRVMRLIHMDWSVAKIEEWIEENSTNLVAAKFDTEPCMACPSNSQKQFDLFGLGDADAKCLNIDCFKGKLLTTLEAGWEASKHRKKYGTVRPSIDTDRCHEFSGKFKPDAGCKACEKFVTVYTLAGIVKHGQSCLDFECLHKKANKQSAGNKAAANRMITTDPEKTADSPRCSWHGKLFREKFYIERLPLAIAAKPADDVAVAHMTLFALMKAHSIRKEMVGYFKECGIDTTNAKEHISGYYEDRDYFGWIKQLTLEQAREGIKRASAAIVMDWRTGGYGFNTPTRDVVAEHFDLRVERDYAPTEEYFHAKTKKEIVAYLKDLPKDKLKQVEDFMLKRNPKDSFGNHKKEELIRFIKDSGVDLTGCAPKEIIQYQESAFVPNQKMPGYQEARWKRDQEQAETLERVRQHYGLKDDEDMEDAPIEDEAESQAA